MSHNVFANGMEVSCKASSGKTICNFPDVCLSPPPPPAGPIPIPYPNTGMASDTSEGSTTVQIAGQEVMLKNKSCFSKSTGDEAATKAQGMGVVTHEITGKVYFTAWSMDVKVEGENVPRNLDLTTNNHMSKMPGNTPPMPHISTMAMAMPATVPPCKAAPGAGNPVNPVVGCKFLTGEDDRDFALDGPLDLTWQRQYFSDNPRIGWLGQGWMLPFEVFVEVNATDLTLVDSQGRRISSRRLSPGEGVFLPTERSWIRCLDGGRIAWDMPEGIRMVFGLPGGAGESGDRFELSVVQDRNGNEHRIERINDTTRDIWASGGQHLRLQFLKSGRLASVSQILAPAPVAAGAVTEPIRPVLLANYDYDDDGNLVAVRDRAGTTRRRFTWNNHMMASHTTASGLVSSYEWDDLSPLGRVTHFTSSDGKSLRFEYGAEATIITDELERSERFLKDANGRWIGVIDAIGGEHRRVLDKDGNVVALVEPDGRAYVSRLNERGLPEETTAPNGARTQVEWHAEFDLPTKVTDPLGRAALYEYDERGNLIRQVSRDGSVTKYVVDQRGLVVEVVDAAGGIERVEYNQAGQPLTFTDSSEKVTRLTYDENGWLTSIVDPLSQVTWFRYDRSGNCTAEIYPDGSQKLYVYDAAGRLREVVDGYGNRTSFVLRSDGQPESRTDPEGNTLVYRYDLAGRLVTLLNENGSAYRFEYDVLNRLVKQVNVDQTSVTYAYSESGFPREVIEEGNDASRIANLLEFDDVGQLVATLCGGEETRFGYDAAGNIVAASNRTSRITLTYDELDRIVEEVVAHRSGDSVLRYTYDSLGNCSSLQTPDGRLIRYLTSGAGHIRQINVGGRQITSSQRDDLHREVFRTQGRLATRFAYDPVGRVLDQTTIEAENLRSGPQVPPPGAPSKGPWIRTYRYAKNGNLLDATSGSMRRTFAYDRADRLVRHTSAGVDERFSFDPATNLIDLPGQRVIDDRVSRHGGVEYSFDGFGRVVAKSGGPRGRLRFEWNDRHEMIAVEAGIDGALSVVRYDYDPFGRRVAKVGPRETIRFVWDGDQLLEEWNGVHRVSYLYTPGTYDPVASLIRLAEHEAIVTGEESLNQDVQIYFYHTDEMGTPERVSSEDGEWIWAARYGAFGGIIEALPGARGAVAASQPLRFQGQYFDQETGLHYNRHRYYDPDVGRFLSPDPIGLEGGINLYLYAPNPTGWIDPEGLASYPLPSVTGFQQHHIVPQQLQNHPALKKAGFDIHDEKNIIFLPKCEAAHPTKTIHRGSHPKYTQNVLARLNKISALGKQYGWTKAQYQAAIKSEISKLRRGLNRGTTKLNKNSTRTGKCTTCGC